VNPNQTEATKDLHKKRKLNEKRLTALLKKFVTYMVLSWMFWIVDYIPFLPRTPLVVGVSIWVLHPHCKGESVIYLILSDYMDKFVFNMRVLRNAIFGNLLWAVLKLANLCVSLFKDKTSNDMLLELRALTEQSDADMVKELFGR